MSAPAGTLPVEIQPRRQPLEAVGSHAATGAFWTVLFSALNKCLAMGSQIALARLLLPDQFGLVATTLSVASFVAIMCGSTLKTVLTQRADNFEQNASPAFWLALLLNLAGALLLVIAAPLAGRIFHDSRVTPLILVFAIAVPFQALPTIYAAALARHLRFRQIAMIHFGAGIIQNGLGVILALLGFGAYSLILPLVAMALYMAVAYRVAAGKISVQRPQWRQWGELQRSASWLMAVTGLTAIQTTGAGFVISLFHDSQVTGYFYWGYTVSTQIVFLLATNLQQVVMAVLARLNLEKERQAAAAAKTIQTLVIVVLPVCLLQALLARPIIAFVFHDRWLPAVAVVQCISVGMWTQPLNLLAGAVLMARGEFRRLAGATAIIAGLILAAAAFGSSIGQQREIALCVTTALVIGNLYAGWLVFREFNKGARDLLRALLPALQVTSPVLALSWGVSRWTAALHPLVSSALTAATCLGLYFVMLWRFHPVILNEILLRFSRRKSHPEAAVLKS